ncbi:MAG: NeuD/PglB/VioB family sugar acetyltransferase [Selenomonas sp.]|nr:NeuD/PglB/VioB family sugar acetyltransferase [Selenomonas sp.]
MKHLLIIGIGGFAREVFWHAHESIGYGTDWDIKGFLDGDVKLAAEEYEKLSAPVLGDVVAYVPQPEDCFICAIGSPQVKEKLIQGILDKGGEFINIIHRTAIVHPTVQMGRGNILCPLVHVLDHARVGNFVTFNGRSGMGHDAEIGDYSSVMSAADITGYVRAGRRTFWGSGARAVPHSRIDDDAVIGVASVVFRHVKKGVTVFGNPAMPI